MMTNQPVPEPIAGGLVPIVPMEQAAAMMNIHGQEWKPPQPPQPPQPGSYRTKPGGSIPTTWRISTYDVWGNAKDGWDINNVYQGEKVELHARRTRYNVGTPHEFAAASLSDRQIKRVFGVTCRIATDGDDLHYEVERERDGYPIGRLECVSHESLSPVRKVEVQS